MTSATNGQPKWRVIGHLSISYYILQPYVFTLAFFSVNKHNILYFLAKIQIIEKSIVVKCSGIAKGTLIHVEKLHKKSVWRSWDSNQGLWIACPAC